jgi:hypothetical protein
VHDLVKYTKAQSPELAEYLEGVAGATLTFDGDDPLAHSADNHIHLWKLEFLSDTNPWIDTDYRTEFVKYIFEQWRMRLKGLHPYRERGYRVYVYEDLAPTVSVVAETDIGFPYMFGSPIFVESIIDVVRPYAERSWLENFSGREWELPQDSILNAVEKHKGSIGQPTANSLGTRVGALRKVIINMGLGGQVNTIRKRHNRRPADFSDESLGQNVWRVFERRLPAGYK